MVGYGAALRKSRRPGWEEAYLDYDGLKSIRNNLEAALVERDKVIATQLSFARTASELAISPTNSEDVDEYLHKYHDLTVQFATKLHSEIEKVSLFALSRMGELGDAVGALRFMKQSNGGLHDSATSEEADQLVKTYSEESDKAVEISEMGFSVDEFGEKSALLPPATRRSTGGSLGMRRKSTTSFSGQLFSTEKLTDVIGRGHQINNECDKIKYFSDLGVELLHLLKFTCLNSVGIRKIVKKYEKLLLFFPITKQVRNAMNVLDEQDGPLMPKSLMQKDQITAVRDNRLRQLSNIESIDIIYASLIDALAECKKAQRDAAVDILLSSKKVCNSSDVLRFECTISSIHTLMEFAHDVRQPFQVFLSRKAMIGTGKDRGEIGNENKKAIKLLLVFEPDFILDMSDKELQDWYRSATMKVKPSMHKKSASFIDFVVGDEVKKWGGADSAAMIMNLMSTLLYTVNYYIIAPTANHYASLLGTDGAYGATLIGASSFAAIFAAFFYSVWYTKASFRSALEFSAICPLIGNLLYSLAITYESMKMALVGRILCGFGSAEVVNRQLISACVSYQSMTKASALFVSVSAAGMSVGPLVAAVLDMTSGRDSDIDVAVHLPGSPKDSGIIFNHTTNPGFLMAFLWALQMLSLVFFFNEPERINSGENDSKKESSLEIGSYGSASSTSVDNSLQQSQKDSSFWTVWKETISLLKVIFSNAAYPITLFLFAFIELSGEVLISSCSMVVRRYFGWHGSRAGFIIASLGALVLPAHFIVERASHFYSERRILKLSIIFVILSILAICNYEGLLLDAAGEIVEHSNSKSARFERMRSIVKSSLKHNEFPYDWHFGEYVYLIALSAIFIGAIIMEGVNTSLMAKAAPNALNDTFFNVGLMATLVGTLGRVVGDSMITICAFIGRSPLYDFVSVTYLPLLPIILLGLYWVRKYYKFLI